VDSTEAASGGCVKEAAEEEEEGRAVALTEKNVHRAHSARSLFRKVSLDKAPLLAVDGEA